jgi:mannose-6-phosphate isomerase-like protein (cupin superfamily)
MLCAEELMGELISKSSAEHYTWGDGCDGWFLLKSAGFHVIEERMPPGTEEKGHYHSRSEQLFYVLAGELTMRFEKHSVRLRAREAVRVVAGEVHQAGNESGAALEFLVISCPPSHGDRTNVE